MILLADFLQDIDPGDMDPRAYLNELYDQLGTKQRIALAKDVHVTAHRFVDQHTHRQVTIIPMWAELFKDPDLQGDG